MMEEQEFSLADIAQEFARSDPTFEKFHGKVFSFLLPDSNLLINLMNSANLKKDSFPNKHPANIFFGKLSKLLPLQVTHVPSVRPNGSLELHFTFSKLELPDRQYFSIVSPVPNNQYALAFESINFVKSWLALWFGKLPFYTWLADYDFDIKGKVSIPSESFRRPMFADFIKLADPTLAIELIERLSLQMPDYRLRIQRGCNFLSYAMNQKNEMFRFSSYWIALEVLVGGTDDAIKSELATAYGLNKHLAGRQLRFDEIAGVRHKLLHQGVFNTLAASHERLMHLYFWDIVIHQIGLSPRGLAQKLIETGVIEEETTSTAHR